MKTGDRGQGFVTYELIELLDRHQVIARRNEWLRDAAIRDEMPIRVVSSDEIPEINTTDTNILQS